MSGRLRPAAGVVPFARLVGVGGIGTGIFLTLEGNRTLGREESRGARLLEGHDACKLHIVAHHVSTLLEANPSGRPFHVVPIGTVGADEAGRGLRSEMARAGMDTGHVTEAEGRPTLFSVCFQYPDGAGGNLTTVDSAAAALGPEDVDRAEPLITEAGRRAIVLALPEVSVDARRRLLQLGTQAGAYRVASFLSSEVEEARATGLLDAIDLISMNRDEASALVGAEFDPADPEPFLELVAKAIAGDARSVRVVVSAGASGAFGLEGGHWQHRPALKVDVVNAAGAGDALLGGVLAALAVGVPMLAEPPSGAAAPEARLAGGLDLGVLLAAYAVTSRDTIHPVADLGSLLSFAAAHGLVPGPPLARAVEGA